MTALCKLKRLLAHCENVITHCENLLEITGDDDMHTDVQWEIAYRAIFNKNVSSVMFQLYQEVAGHRLSYYDPDTSYEEDVRAFVSSFKEAIQGIDHPFVL